MAATMSRSSSRSSWLPDSEAQEFNQVTYERIKSYTDISKLKRLERYMREEGFSKTAELTRQTIVEKGGKDPYDTEHCVNDVDVDNVLKSINSWQASIKDIDSRLQELQQTKGQDISNGESNSFLKVDSMCPKVRERVKGMQSITHETETLEKKLKPHLKNDLRSGREYYSQWDKYISQWEKDSEKCMEIGNEVDSIEDRVSTIKDNQKTRKIKQITYKSQLEREWIAQREREKGNDLFKAKEYTASLQAYNLSIQLFSGSALAYANRAAVNLKMQRWDDAYEDCCKAIDIDPNYSKAFLRRAMASLEMDKPEEALKDLEVADSMETASEEVRKLKIEAEKKVSKKFQERFSHSDCTHQTVGSKCESLPRGARRLAIEEVNGTTENTKNKVNAQCCEVENSGISKTNKVETSEPHNLNKSSPIVKQFSADEWHKKGNLHYSNGEYMEAESCYSKYLTSDPNNVIVLSNRSMCRLKLCKYEEAEVDATQAIMISPGFVKAYYRRGLARRSLGKLWEAKEDLQRVLEDVPNEKGVLEYFESLKEELEDYLSYRPKRKGPMIIEEIHEEVNDSKGEPAVEFTNGSIHTDGKTKEQISQNLNAINCTDRLLPIKSTVDELVDQADFYLKASEYQKAVSDCTKAISIDSCCVKAFSIRAEARKRMADFMGSLSDFRAVLNLSPNDARITAEIEEITKQQESAFSKQGMADQHRYLKDQVSDEMRAVDLLCPKNLTKSIDCSKQKYGNVEQTNLPVGILERASQKAMNAIHIMNDQQDKKSVSFIQRPNTALEFERGCLRLQKYPVLLKQYLQGIDCRNLRVIFKEAFSTNAIRVVADSIMKAFMPDNPKGAFHILEGFTSVKRFQLVMILLNSIEREKVLNLFDWIEKSNEMDSFLLSKVKSQYLGNT